MQPARKDMGEKLKNGNRTNLNLQNLIILSCIILIYLILANIPNSGGALPVSGQKELAIMVCVIIAWIFEIVPIGTAAMLALMMQVPLGILDLDSVMTNFAQTILFFVIGCFCIAAGMKRCGLGNRLMLLITKSAKGCPNKMLLLFMFLAAIISMFISDLAITAMLFPIAVAILKKNNMEAGKSNYGKAVMLGIPMAALIGGIGTPAGAPMNYLALSLMEQAVGMKVTFAQWCCIGIPIVVILIPICWFVITRCYKCEVEHLIGSEEAEKDLKSLGKLTINEWKFILIILITLVFWITEWLPLPVTSFLGGAMFFLPGIELNDVSVIKNDVDWNVLMLNVCSAALGVGVMQTGGAAWLAQGVLGGIGGLNTVSCYDPADCSIYSGYSSGNTGKHSSGIDPCSDGSKLGSNLGNIAGPDGTSGCIHYIVLTASSAGYSTGSDTVVRLLQDDRYVKTRGNRFLRLGNCSDHCRLCTD